jgi:hypothetical protein
MECLNLSKLVAYQNQLLNDKEEQLIQQHLSGCTKCKKQVTAYQNLGKFLKRTLPFEQPADTTECYDEYELVSFIESRPDRKSNSKYFLHLTQCQSCIDKFLALENLLNELKLEGLLPAQSGIKEKVIQFITNIKQTAKDKLRSIRDVAGMPLPAYRWAGIAVILFVAAFVFLPRDNQNNTPFTTREQNKFETGLQLLFPIDEITINGSGPQFQWEEVTEASKYNILLLDANGDIVWEKQTSNNKINLPYDIRLLPSMTYYWQVEGNFEDGSTIVSEMFSFSIKQ